MEGGDLGELCLQQGGHGFLYQGDGFGGQAIDERVT